MLRDETIRRVLRFRDDRDWRQFHTPKDLAISLPDGLSEVVLLRDIRNLGDLNSVASSILRQDFTSDDFYFFRASHVEFYFDDDVPWTLDGEFGGEVQAARLSVLPGALRLLGAQAAE